MVKRLDGITSCGVGWRVLSPAPGGGIAGLANGWSLPSWSMARVKRSVICPCSVRWTCWRPVWTCRQVK